MVYFSLLYAPIILFLLVSSSSSASSRIVERKPPVNPKCPDGRDCSKFDQQAKTKCKNVPEATQTIQISKPTTVKAGQRFDCKLKRYQHVNKACNLDEEKGNKDAVFILEEGASLVNCILGFSQESVTCLGTCHIQNCHWRQICDEAISLGGTSKDSTIKDSSFSNAGNKAIQFNGGGKVIVERACFSNVDIAYRSCGTNCRSSERRDIDMTSIELHGVNTLAGYNANNGDRVSVKQAKGEGVKNMCKAFQQQVKSESKLMQQSGVASQPGCEINGGKR